MKQTIQIGGTGKKIEIDSDLITVKSRKAIKKKFEKPATVLVDDKELLSKMEAEFKVTAPTQQRIYECFTTLIKPVEEDNEDDFLEECCRICCKWLKEDGKPGAVLTEKEFQELPYNVGLFISRVVFSEVDKSFLVVAPEGTSA